MESSNAKALVIGLRVSSSEGLEAVRRALKEVQSSISIAAVSSIYKVSAELQQPTHVHDLRTLTAFHGYVAALRGFTNLSPEEVKDFLFEIEVRLRSEALRQKVSLRLLLFGSQTKMTPELTLPDPDFHRYVEELYPAVEVAGDLQHPVLRKSLRDLAKSVPSLNWGEFVSQGKAMLDF